jgi:hypothetical protein
MYKGFEASKPTLLTPEIIDSGLVYFSRIFSPKGFGDGRGFSVHPIPSNTLKYSSPKIH